MTSLMDQAAPIFKPDIAKRYADCKHFTFAPGVLLYGGDRIGEHTAAVDIGVVPDYTDAATRGCLLEIVRKTYDDPRAYLCYSHGAWLTVVKTSPFRAPELGADAVFRAWTEGESLLLALETAEKRRTDGTLDWRALTDNGDGSITRIP